MEKTKIKQAEETLDVLEDKKDFEIEFMYGSVNRTIKAKDGEEALRIANKMLEEDENFVDELKDDVELIDVIYED